MQNTIFETYMRLTDADMDYDEYLMHCSTIIEPKPVYTKKSSPKTFKADVIKYKSCIL
jgi:hypothetical protein